jgi:hypothetical protein
MARTLFSDCPGAGIHACRHIHYERFGWPFSLLRTASTRFRDGLCRMVIRGRQQGDDYVDKCNRKRPSRARCMHETIYMCISSFAKLKATPLELCGNI